MYVSHTHTHAHTHTTITTTPTPTGPSVHTQLHTQAHTYIIYTAQRLSHTCMLAGDLYADSDVKLLWRRPLATGLAGESCLDYWCTLPL